MVSATEDHSSNENVPAISLTLVCSPPRSAELLSEIDVNAASTGTSQITSNMHSRLASNSKASRQASEQRRKAGTEGRTSTGAMPPPSFEDANSSLLHAPHSTHTSRRYSGTTQRLAFATPSAAESTPARPAQSGGAPLPPLSSMLSPIMATPAPPARTSLGQSDNEQMTDATPASQAQSRLHASTPLPQPPPSQSSMEGLLTLGKLHLPLSLTDTPAPLSSDACDQYLLAKSYFDLKEYQRAAFVLRDEQILPLAPVAAAGGPLATLSMQACPNSPSNRVLFLRCYSLYLAGEKRKAEELLEKNKGGVRSSTESASAQNSGMGAGPGEKDGERTQVHNRELRGIQATLTSVLVRDASTLTEDGSPRPDHPLAPFINDGHLWFLYGIVLRELGLRSAARNAILVSVVLFPWNWGAWQVLQGFITERAHLEQVMTFLDERLADQQAATERQHAALAAEAESLGLPALHPLPPHASGIFMKDFFYAEALISLQANAELESLGLLNRLCMVFPDSMAVRTTTAMAHYNRREFEYAEHLFELAAHLDPHRLDHMDTYSNILYVRNDKARLSSLAHRAHATDKYRVQTNCIIGNYYAARGMHDQSILYFRRALAVDPSYLSAWTLMGHEYVELRNTNMAIESYRKALDINPLDFRAWYGLGQTYEILQMNKYSLYYFKKSCEIKPYDPRLWNALGENFEKLASESTTGAAGSGAPGSSASRMLESAIKCYKKAVANNDEEGVALHKLAKLYRRRGQTMQAAEYYQKVLAHHDGSSSGAAEDLDALDSEVNAGQADPAKLDASMASASGSGAAAGGGDLATAGVSAPLHLDAIDALLFLAEYYFKTHRSYVRAESYCNRLLDMGGHAKEAAKSLLVEIRLLKTHQQNRQKQMAQQQSTGAKGQKTPAAQQRNTAAAAESTPRTSPPRSATAFRAVASTATPAAAAANASQLSSPGFFSSPSGSP